MSFGDSVDSKFGDLQGIVLFSPGIEEKTVARLAEFIQERLKLEQSTWGGSICYFTLGGLRKLYDLYKRDENDVQSKERGFRNRLHIYLQDPDKHDDIDIIERSNFRSVKFDVDDAISLFNDLDYLENEEEIFNVDDYMVRAGIK